MWYIVGRILRLVLIVAVVVATCWGALTLLKGGWGALTTGWNNPLSGGIKLPSLKSEKGSIDMLEDARRLEQQEREVAQARRDREIEADAKLLEEQRKWQQWRGKGDETVQLEIAVYDAADLSPIEARITVIPTGHDPVVTNVPAGSAWLLKNQVPGLTYRVVVEVGGAQQRTTFTQPEDKKRLEFKF